MPGKESTSGHGSNDSEFTRRKFLKASIAAGAITSLGMAPGCNNKETPPKVIADEPPPIAPTNAPEAMQFRMLGRTGQRVSILGLGGFHIGTQQDEKQSIKLIRAAVDNGVNFLDNCWDYNDGQSEIRMGSALRDGYRKKVFLMTKIDGRDKKTAAQQLEESMRRLQTDTIDLVQMHEVIRMTDPEKVFADGGGIDALIEARKAGKLRFIGFTGHKSPEIHLKMLETASTHGFRFDTVQMPLNVMDAHFDSFTAKVLPVLVKEEIGVLGMKPFGGGFIPGSKTVDPIDCLHYAMNLPTSVVITGIDAEPILDQALKAARTFRPMNQKQVDAILARTAAVARNGDFERYKTTEIFDSTTKHPEYLGT